MKPILLLLAAAALGLDARAQSWTQSTPTPYPLTPARRSGGIAFDPTRGALLLYGGLQSGPTATLNDTWTFDGVVFTQLTPTTTPPPRWGHRLVLDTARNRIVTFGGRSPTTTANANDTWEWDGSDWAQVPTTSAPSPRAFYSMVYDVRRARTVLYGNQFGTAPAGTETWEYDGTDWTRVVTATTPPGLETPAMAYDLGRGVVVMFGGATGPTLQNQTWEYDGTDWTLRNPATVPVGRYRAGCAYDDQRGRVVLYGGFGNGTALQDTWEYDGNDWSQVANAGPTRSTEAYVAWLPTLQRTVHFAGSGPGGSNNETWFYDGPSTAIAAPFGRGCATSAGLPALAAGTRPVLGTGYRLDLGVGTFAGVGAVAHGFSNLVSPLGPLPLDLGPLGLGGCRLEVSPDTSLLALLVAGTAQQTLNLPNDPSLTFVRIWSQALVLDPAAPNGLGGASNALHAVLGS